MAVNFSVVSGLAREFVYIWSKYFLSKSIPENWNRGEKGNVILVPGFMDDHVFLMMIGDALNKEGFRIHTLKNFDTTRKSVKFLAEILVDYIRQNKLENIILVAHSKGGIVSRYAIDNFEDINERVKLVFTISTPHKGTLYAKTNLLNLDELSPKSKILNNLSLNRKNCQKIVNIYPKLDNTIVPNCNLILDGAEENISIDVIGHTSVLKNEKTIKIIVDKTLEVF